VQLDDLAARLGAVFGANLNIFGHARQIG
jgi:hypothetical protein